jgi:hypothetical protein
MASMPADWQDGRLLELPDARSLALGGVSVCVGSPFGFLANPALSVVRYDQFNAPELPLTRPRPVATLAGHFGVVSEQRTRTLYDSYDNAVGELAVADNSTTSGLLGPIAASYPLGELALGLGVIPSRDYSYHFRQEYRDDFYQLIGTKELDMSGQVTRFGLTGAYDIANVLGIGFGFNLLTGVQTLDSAIAGSLPVQRIRQTLPTALAVNLGLLAHFTPALRIGLTVQPATLAAPGFLAGGSDSSATQLAEPLTVKLGANYLAAAQVPTGVHLQLGYYAWPGLDTLLSPTLDLRAGVEHRLLDNLLLRYGFGLLPSPVNPGVQEGLVSLGLGLETDLAHIDLGSSLRRRTFGSDFLVPSPTVDLKTYQTSLVIGVAVSRTF